MDPQRPTIITTATMQIKGFEAFPASGCVLSGPAGKDSDAGGRGSVPQPRFVKSATAAELATGQRGREGRALTKPLLPVRGVVSLIDRDEDAVLKLLEIGDIGWAWDLSLEGRLGRTKEIRVLPAAVADYMMGRPCAMEWTEVLQMLLPAGVHTLRTPRVTRLLNISFTHLFSLGRRKLIRSVGTWGPGPAGAANWDTQSIVNFLQARRFP